MTLSSVGTVTLVTFPPQAVIIIDDHHNLGDSLQQLTCSQIDLLKYSYQFIYHAYFQYSNFQMQLEHISISSQEKSNSRPRQVIYTFPQEDFPRYFENLQAIKAIINQNHLGLEWYMRKYDFYLYLKCSKCNATVCCRIDDDGGVIVTSMRTLHIHKGIKQKNKQSRLVIDYLKSLPNNIEVKAKKALTKQQFSINDRRFYYLLDQLNSKLTFQELVKDYESKGHQLRVEWFQEQNLPSMFLTVSQLGKLNFIRYGDVVYFDITYNLIRQQWGNGKQYGVGVFSGMDCNRRIIIFGICLLSSELTQDFIKLFRSFVSIMQKEPRSIITDQQQAIGSALHNLKQEGELNAVHLLDSYHILKNLKKKVKDKQQLRQYCYLLHAKTQQQFDLRLDELLLKGTDQQKLKDFIIKGEKYIFHLCPNSFFGFLSSTSSGQKLNDLIKTRIEYKLKLTEVFRRLQNLQKELFDRQSQIQPQNCAYEDVFFDQRLNQVRKVLQKKPFHRFITNYVLGLHWEISQTLTQYSLRKKGATYNIEKQEELECPCFEKQKSGIPCSHILKIQFYNQESYVKYINKRWIAEVQLSQDRKRPNLRRRGRPRKSRRNIQK